VQTQFGWHLIRLNESRDQAVPPLEEVRGQIESDLRREAAASAVEQVVQAAEVTTVTEGLDPAALNALDLLEQ